MLALGLGAVLGAAGCGGAATEPAPSAPAAATSAPPPARSTQARAMAATTPTSNHDYFAAQNIQCATCHPCGSSPTHATGWMDEGSAGFHAASANSGLANCQSCHGANLDGVGGATAVSCAMCHGEGWATRCTMCHGGVDSQTGAPPKATWGQQGDPVRVGAHTAHLGATHGLAAPVACSACHTVPADAFATGHVDGATATVAFSGLAALGTPAWTRASATCSGVYCHGATLAAGGANTSPVWTATDGSQIGCGSCHGAPPPTPHPQNPSCGSCHPGYTASTVNAATHVDGTVELGGSGLTCTACHGTEGTNAAPPVGTRGETATSAMAVGAHQAHLQGGPLAGPVACGECHAVPTSMSHADGTATVTFGPLATAGGAQPSFDVSSGSCSGTYCHGQFPGGNALNAPLWNVVDGSQVVCGSCHGTPPGSGHPQNASCGNCHTGYTSASVNKALHMNGTLDLGAMTCTSCHGAAGQPATAGAPLYAAPPVDTLGASTGLRVGAHQAHVAGETYSSGVACQDCHPQVATYTTTHANGVAQVAFTNGTSASFNVGTYTARSGTRAASCSATWCHAVKSATGQTSGGTLPTPAWNGTITSCTACHGVSPSTGMHRSEHGGYPCGYCHPGYASTSGANGMTVNPAVHVNGARDVGGTGTRIRTWNAATRSCQPMCHGSERWN